MNTETTSSLIGQYLSITGMVHSVQACGTRGRNKAALITADDVAYWEQLKAKGINVAHQHCERCA
jgi:hypothetical protein